MPRHPSTEARGALSNVEGQTGRKDPPYQLRKARVRLKADYVRQACSPAMRPKTVPIVMPIPAM
jgi:hypothetical protein